MSAYFTRSGGAPASFNVPGSVVKTSTSYAILPTNFYIGCLSGGITITLPLGSSVSTGQTYVIKDESGTALSSNITINPSGPNLIDGNTSVKLYNNYMSLTLLWTGTLWSVI
jgi:hypothetical protein